MVTYNNTTDNYGTSSFIVDSTAGKGNYTTIQAAITAASSGTTIFIRPGTYTENLTLKAGVNLTGWLTDADNGTVIILGKCTFTAAGTVIISSVQLKTNSDNFLSMSGSNATNVQLISCYLNASNATGISNAVASASSNLLLYDCGGDLGTTGIAMFSDSSTGTLSTFFCTFDNSGGSSTANTKSAGILFSNQSRFTNPITYSSSSTASGMNYDQINTATQNATCFTTSGTGSITLTNCLFLSGSASAMSAGAGTTIGTYGCTLNSTNAAVIAGAGTCGHIATNYSGSGHQNSVTTQTGAGSIAGLQNTTATNTPPAGFLGELQTAVGTGVSISNATPTNVCSIALTPGVWDVSGMVAAIPTGNWSTAIIMINSTSASFTGQVNGQNANQDTRGSSNSNVTFTIMPQRITLTANTTYYLVCQINFSTGTATANGKISATRVG